MPKAPITIGIIVTFMFQLLLLLLLSLLAVLLIRCWGPFLKWTRGELKPEAKKIDDNAQGPTFER